MYSFKLIKKAELEMISMIFGFWWGILLVKKFYDCRFLVQNRIYFGGLQLAFGLQLTFAH
jgi:hypothetical protein